jgi:hypothetical protein
MSGISGAIMAKVNKMEKELEEIRLLSKRVEQLELKLQMKKGDEKDEN